MIRFTLNARICLSAAAHSLCSQAAYWRIVAFNIVLLVLKTAQERFRWSESTSEAYLTYGYNSEMVLIKKLCKLIITVCIFAESSIHRVLILIIRLRRSGDLTKLISGSLLFVTRTKLQYNNIHAHSFKISQHSSTTTYAIDTYWQSSLPNSGILFQ
ncbi:hypothetical protein Tsp_04437 [Trichinella spiralis]|uniref:hypothetical protein n=1 Tax=Trichinella spiralis TaxID=6334 RepID=UPI0001EFEAEE|nr:hypothetical protein Tsp_04437 [Trichinella spiralis]